MIDPQDFLMAHDRQSWPSLDLATQDVDLLHGAGRIV
jgi:hypothetical protein